MAETFWDKRTPLLKLNSCCLHHTNQINKIKKGSPLITEIATYITNDSVKRQDIREWGYCYLPHFLNQHQLTSIISDTEALTKKVKEETISGDIVQYPLYKSKKNWKKSPNLRLQTFREDCLKMIIFS